MSIAPAAVSQADIAALDGEVRRWAPVSHLFWGIWGLIQATISDIDFDYVEYAHNRISKYRSLLADRASTEQE